jgi:hypothetical protein
MNFPSRSDLQEDRSKFGDCSIICSRDVCRRRGCQASPGPEKIEAAGFVRGTGSGRSVGPDRKMPPLASYRLARSSRRRRVNESALSPWPGPAARDLGRTPAP